MKEQSRFVAHNIAWNLLLSLSSLLFSLLTFPYVTRVLGVQTNGAISFASSLVSYFALFAGLGISTYGVKACAQVKQDREKLSQVAQELWIISAAAAAVVLGVLYLLLLFVPALHRYRGWMLVYSANIWLNVLGMNWMYQGIEKFRFIAIRSLVFKLLSLVLVFIFVRDAQDGLCYAVISVFASGAGNLCNAICAHRHIRCRPLSSYQFKRHCKPLALLFATTLAVNVYSQMDTVMLGFFCGDYATGIYSVAVKIKTILLSMFSSASVVMLSSLAAAGKGGEGEVRPLLQRSYAMTIFITVPVCVYGILLAQESVVFLSGADFAIAGVPMKILMPTVVLSALSQIIGSQYSVSTGRERNLMVAVVSGAAVNLACNALLIPRFGYNGAALGTLIAEAAQCAIQMLLAREIIQQVFCPKKLCKVGLAAAVAAALVLLLRQACAPLGEFKWLMLSALLFGTVYIGILAVVRYDVFVWLKDSLGARKDRCGE